MDIKLIDRNKKEYKIVLFGDSISRGFVFDEILKKYKVTPNNYVNVLKESLNAGIDNKASFGNTIIRGLRRIPKILDKKGHDIALIEFGGNDCDYDWNAIAKDPTLDHKPKTDFNEFERQLTSLIQYVRECNMFPVLMSLPPIDSDKYFQWVSQKDETSKKNILSFLGTTNRIYWWQERYNSVILSVAKNTKTTIIDVRSSFLRKEDYRDYLCIDGIHPNDKGHKIIADTIFDFISEEYSFLLNK